MSDAESSLGFKLGALTEAIQSSRNDSNRRFDSINTFIVEQKKDLQDFKIQVQTEFHAVNEKFTAINTQISKWQGMIVVLAAIPTVLLILIQIADFLKK